MRSRVVLCLAVLFLIGAALPASANITQGCTVGFYKNHPQFITNGACTQMTFDQNTVVSTVFPDVDPCVGAMTFLQVLSAPSSACGSANSMAGAEIILLRQTIARLANAANSTPLACNALKPTVNLANTTIDDGIANDSRDPLISVSAVWDAKNNGTCTLQ
jgi:hypothetical protein